MSAERAKILDPLADFEFKNDKLKLLVVHSGEAEVYAHGANLSAKTTTGAYFAVALARGEEELGGVPIPQFQQPSAGALILQTYKAGGLASLAKLREAIGAWPSFEAPTNRALDEVGIIYIKPKKSRATRYEKWSRIYLFPHGGAIPAGIRLDWVWADEPPPERMWREMRWRWQADKQFVAYITATPLERVKADGSGWGWLMNEKEFGSIPDGEIREAKLRIESSIYDNKALTRADLLRAERAAASDEHGDARLWGHHVDTAGHSPFKGPAYAVLREMKARCIPAPETDTVRIDAEEDTPEGRKIIVARVKVGVWHPPEPGELYYVIGDPALGVEDDTHDKSALIVLSRRHPRVCAWYTGFLDAYGLGSLMAFYGERYSNAWVWPLVTGGYGGPTLTAINAYRSEAFPSGYHYVGRDRDVTRPESSRIRLGMVETSYAKGEMVSALKHGLLRRLFECQSLEVVQQLMDVIVDERDRVIRGEGRRREALVCLGYGLGMVLDPLEAPPKERVSPRAKEFNQALGRAGFPVRKRPIMTRPRLWRR